MKARKFILAVVTIAGVSVATVFAQPKATPELRQKTFEKVWQTVNEKFWDPNFGGVDWKAAHARYAPLAASTKTDAEFYELMNKMLGELKTSHMSIITPDEIAKLKRTPATVGMGYREIENRIVITRVIDGSSALKSELKPGFVITKIGGDPVISVAEAQKKLDGEPNTTVNLAYLDEKDEAHETVLERIPFGDENKSKLVGFNFYALFGSKRLVGNIGYISFTNFLAFLKPPITSAIESMREAPGIIIDLRGNTGGDDSVGIEMASMFFNKEKTLMMIRTRRTDRGDYKTKGSKDPFTGKVVILVDEYSRSASEEFSAGMQESGRAVVIGKTSAGADMDGALEKLPDGSILFYAQGQPRTPKGYIVEGHGVKPDIEIGLTRKELLAGKDAQLEAAIEYIKANTK